ncbi:hypothetical protein D9M68_448320 [compost metagenome]
MTGHVGQVEHHAVIVDTEVVDEVAGQVQRRDDLVGELQIVDLLGRHRQHVHLHLATGVLVFLQQVQAGLQFAVGGFQLLAVAPVLQAQVRTIQSTAHRMLEHREVFQGLDQVIGGTQAQGLDHVTHDPGAGNHDHRDFDFQGVDATDQLQAVHLRHAQVTYDQIGLAPFEDFQPLQTIGSLQDAEAAVFQIGRETRADYVVVIDDQQRGTGIVHGVPGKRRQENWRKRQGIDPERVYSVHIKAQTVLPSVPRFKHGPIAVVAPLHPEETKVIRAAQAYIKRGLGHGRLQ